MRFPMLLALLAWSSLSAIAAAQPTLSHATPAAITPGATTEITLHGAKLDDPLQLWASFPGSIEMVPAAADAKDLTSRVCKITLAADTPVGIGGLAVATPAGASDLLFLSVDDLASVTDQGGNHSPEQAQAVTPPVAVDGVSDGNRFDFYKFSATSGQRLSVEVVAARAGSDFDPVVRLLDAAGQEIAFADDDASLGADCRISHTFDSDGEYVVVLHDNQYRSGGRYRLRIGDFPLVSTPYPLAGRAGSTVRLDFAGPASDEATPVLLRIPDNPIEGRMMLSARRADGKSSAAAVLATSLLPEAAEREPNDDLASATEVTLPCGVNGILREPGDADHFQFPGVKGQAVRLTTLSRSVGSPCLATLTLLDSAGQTLSASSASAAEEVALTHTLPADGMYTLRVAELLERGGPDFAYRVELQPQPTFALSLKNDKNVATRFATPAGDGAFALELQCERRGYDGPIQVELVGGTGKFQLFNGLIPAQAKTHRVLVAVTPEAQPGDLGEFRLHATADILGQTFTTSLYTADLNRTQRPQLSQLPTWLDGLLIAATGRAANPLFAVEAPASLAPPAEAGQPVKFSATLQRRHKDFKGGLTVVLVGLPPELTYEVKPEGDRYDVTISGPTGQLTAGGSFQLLAFGDLNARGQLVRQTIQLQQ